MQIKSGVRIYGIRPEVVLALLVAQHAYEQFGEASRFVVTSVADGKHSQGSLHYVGCAVDLRLPRQARGSIINALKANLGPDFDVVLEGSHIHLEFQPKEAY